jgi:hypothetical protein
MAHPTGEAESDVFRLDFDRRLMLQFRGASGSTLCTAEGHPVASCSTWIQA